MASTEELERRIKALEDKVARLERTLNDPSRSLRPIARQSVMFDFIDNKVTAADQPLAAPGHIGPMTKTCGCSTYYVCLRHRAAQ